MGEALGGLVWHFMPLRRKIILRNLRIAFAGEKDRTELQHMAKASCRRTGGNLISAAHTARLAPEKLGEVIHIENLELLEQALAAGQGVVLLLAHMGNWEILSRLVHLFPKGSRAGAFYRPLNNSLLDGRILARRQADGTRMFSKRDNALQVAGFLREGGIVGILADQRVGSQGELVRFFGRCTRASPLPSLLARRAKSAVLALSVTTVTPGKWRAVFLPVQAPHTTVNCMAVLEEAMKAGPVDVFWFQERWQVDISKRRTIRDWLGSASGAAGKAHRALLWLAGAPESWRLPEAWTHPDVVYEVALRPGQALPAWLPGSTRCHALPPATNRGALQKAIAAMDESAALPLDFILASGATAALVEAGRREAVPVISLSWRGGTRHPASTQATPSQHS
jgi:KDO2-lipid IV(A) lauroyltransferase